MPIIVPGGQEAIPLDLTKELALQRRNTHVFIMADPTTIALIPRTEVRQPSGGVLLTDQPARATQTFRLIPQSATTSPARSSSAAVGADTGVTRKYPFVLLAEWDAVMAINDWWQDGNGQRWVIDQLEPSPAYEQRALVTSWGRHP